MTEQQTPVLDPGTQSAPAAPAPAKKKHKKKKAGKIVAAAAVLAGLAVGEMCIRDSLYDGRCSSS